MIFTLIYNEFIKTINIDITKKIGIIQEEILNKCILMIYNIEYTEIIIKIWMIQVRYWEVMT